ncbi:MAG TPA: gamma-glutamyltransferase [Candidatus Saccharimonadales bacterium]|nr:gamma-glutamyltransferase [Candidatus Saccharimonadales bacterium]
MVSPKALVFCVLFLFPDFGRAVQHGAVATVHPLATDAALVAMKRGGNAIDAAVAAALTLGVVDGHNSGIGGGCFLLIRTAKGQVIALDGREMAPSLASKEMYFRSGKLESKLSQTGALAIGVPGSVAAYEFAVKNFGKLSWKQLVLPAAELAEHGFQIDSSYAGRLASVAGEMQRFPATSAIFLTAAGMALKSEDTLKQPDLASSYRFLANEGGNWFYNGKFAQLTAKWMKQNGGLITATDFKKYQLRKREPLRSRYRGFEIVGFPPPSSGGVHVAQILNILEHFDLKAMGQNSPDFVHVITEAMKLAFADRAYWLGDPDFTPVPRGLVATNYAAALFKQISMTRASQVPGHGAPPNSLSDCFSKHTTHFSVADAEGNWVACTATVNTTFGSKVVVPGTGVILNNQMDDFSAQPGAPNFFGLVGAEANSIAPGKRPLSSMSPTIVLKDGQPILSLGAAGGPTIISQTLLAIVAVIDFGMDPHSALKQPRFHHQWLPDELIVEKSMPTATLEELRRRGHHVKLIDSLGACQIIGAGLNGSTFEAAHDPRLNGKAAGF